ncbi:MAG TPA: DUF3889 domain-containing protein [Paenibacillus sp.]|uniref:DUF3889 domain-containing protein n=1 Tax=Paenibacillus sp. TaxID=58172 RepID=UPI0028D7EA6E|nr:DUF3889 domain-containing protein [Paenibacillus sp.]HUC90656.1 DUF3889 domain-containing protein [Paenibacillus sp.]
MRKAIAAVLLCWVILAAHSSAVDARAAIEPTITVGKKELTALARSVVDKVTMKNPEYVEWGRMAVQETKKKYSAEIVDYLHLGRVNVSSKLSEEKFKLWLRKENKEFGVYVTIRFNPLSGRVQSIEYREDT